MIRPPEDLDLVQFSWYVPDKGYVWDNHLPLDRRLTKRGMQKGPFLKVHPEATEEVAYQPFGKDRDINPPLFRKFADLQLDLEGIAKFANSYGWLGVGERISSKPSASVRGETLARWQQEIFEMRMAADIWAWTLLPNGERDERLREAIKHDRKGDLPIYLSYGRWNQMVASTDYRPTVYRFIKYGSPLWKVRAHLVAVVNSKLRGLVAPCLLLNREREMVGALRPTNLLGALWIQLYEAILGQRRIIRCIHCGKLLDVTGKRSTKVAHEACVHNKKVRDYRRRKSKAPRKT